MLEMLPQALTISMSVFIKKISSWNPSCVTVEEESSTNTMEKSQVTFGHCFISKSFPKDLGVKLLNVVDDTLLYEGFLSLDSPSLPTTEVYNMIKIYTIDLALGLNLKYIGTSKV